MAVKQNMTQAITQAATETAKAVLMAVREVDTSVKIPGQYMQCLSQMAELSANLSLTGRQQTRTRNTNKFLILFDMLYD